MIAVAALCCSLHVWADDILIKAAEIRGYGIFEAEVDKLDRLAGTSAPARDAVDGIDFTEYTDQIPGRVGVGFGIEYVIDSTPKGTPITVTNVIRFPGKGMHESDGRTYKVSREKREVRVGYPDFYGFGFDEPSEIIPGKWSVEVYVNKARVVRKGFTVLPPASESEEIGKTDEQ